MVNLRVALGFSLALAAVLPALQAHAQTPTPPTPPTQAAPGQTAPTATPAPLRPSIPDTGTQPSVTVGEPDSESGRYTFHRADDGYLRLDGKLGYVSRCIRWQAGWVCQPVPDERSALEAEITRLQGENAALKREILGRNLSLPSPVAVQPEQQAAPQGKMPPDAAAPTPPDEKTITILTEEEFQGAMAFVQKVWRGLVEMFGGFQRDVFQKT